MKHNPQPLFVIRMGRYNLAMFVCYFLYICATVCGLVLDPAEINRLKTALLALAVDVLVQLPFYFMAFWWKRDRDVTNFIVTIVDVFKYVLSFVKHCFAIWVLVMLIKCPFSWKNICTYCALLQAAQTAYTIIAPILIFLYMKLTFCLGATKLKPGQTQEEALLEYVRSKQKAGKA